MLQSPRRVLSVNQSGENRCFFRFVDVLHSVSFIYPGVRSGSEFNTEKSRGRPGELDPNDSECSSSVNIRTWNDFVSEYLVLSIKTIQERSYLYGKQSKNAMPTYPDQHFLDPPLWMAIQIIQETQRNENSMTI